MQIQSKTKHHRERKGIKTSQNKSKQRQDKTKQDTIRHDKIILDYTIIDKTKQIQANTNQNKIKYKNTKWNEMNRATFVHIQANSGQENLMRMVRWVRWHCPPDTVFKIQNLEVCLSVTESPRNTEFYEWMEKKHFCFFQTAETGKRTQNSSVKGSCANHHPRAAAQNKDKKRQYKTRHIKTRQNWTSEKQGKAIQDIQDINSCLFLLIIDIVCSV